MVSEEKLNELRSTHKRVAVVPYPIQSIDVVLRAPTRAEYKAWRAKKEQPEAMEDLTRQCLVYVNGVEGKWPDVAAAFDALLDTYPALGDSKASGEIMTGFLGLTADTTGKASAPSSPSSGIAPSPSRTA